MTQAEENELRRRVAELETWKRENIQRVRDEIRDAMAKLQGTDGINVQYPIISGSQINGKLKAATENVRSIYYTSGGQLVLGRFKMA